MEQTPQKSRRTLLIGLGAAVGLILIIALVTYVIFGSTKRDDPTGAANTSSENKVATDDEITENFKDLEASMKRAEADQAAAKAALKDDDKRVKVGS